MYVPLAGALRVSIDVPEPPVIEVGLTVAVRPVDGVAVSVTVPAKPFDGVTVIVEVPCTPVLSGPIVVGSAVRLKSGTTTLTVTVAEWESDPLVPVNVMVYVPAGVEEVVKIVRVEVLVPPAVKVTGLGLNMKVRPVTGEVVDAARSTLPAKLYRLASVMVEVAELPATMLAGVAAFAEILKSGGWTMKYPHIGPWCMKHQYV